MKIIPYISASVKGVYFLPLYSPTTDKVVIAHEEVLNVIAISK